MVNSEGQLFTIEGIAAALIMLATAYMVVNSTSVYTPGDAHINDMQLEVIGTDALKMMNTFPNYTSERTLLADVIAKNDGVAFNENFSRLLNNRTNGQKDTIQWTANVSFVRDTDGAVRTVFINRSRPLSGGEHAVKVSQWTIMSGRALEAGADASRKRAVLVEVLLWRD